MKDSFLTSVYIVMGIQWIQVLICLVGLSIPVGVLLFAAADTARAQKKRAIRIKELLILLLFSSNNTSSKFC